MRRPAKPLPGAQTRLAVDTPPWWPIRVSGVLSESPSRLCSTRTMIMPPRGGGFGPVVVLRPGMQGIAASRRFPRLRLRYEFFHLLIRVRPDRRTWLPHRSCGSRRNSLFQLLAEASMPAQCRAIPCVVDDICSSGLPVTRSASSSTLTFGQSFLLLSPGVGVWF